MKNDRRVMLKVSLIIFLIIVFCLGMLWLIDQGFNGAMKEWVYNYFIIEPDYQGQGKVGVIFNSWFTIKQFIIFGSIAFIILLAIFISASIYLYARSRTKKELSRIHKVMDFFTSDSEELNLPRQYSEVGTSLYRIKAAIQKDQQLIKLEMQQKSDLITYLAHDLKTPLASVIGYLSLLEEAKDMPAEQKAKYTGIALEKACRLEELINEFFEITRFNLQSIVLNKEKINLEFMLQQLADEFYPMLSPAGKQVVIHACENLILIGDADKLARVFNNILKNAIAYSFENSIIEITAAKQEDMVVVTFTNKGNPIPAQKLSNIFEKFYRLDAARSTNTGGAGLGLAIAQEIVSAHNGTISVESNLDRTMFIVKLPNEP